MRVIEIKVSITIINRCKKKRIKIRENFEIKMNEKKRKKNAAMKCKDKGRSVYICKN